MSTPRTILIVDPDPETARSLGPALRRRGYHVIGAPDGSRALQLAVLRAPDLVLVDEDAPLVNARTFVRILRTNPRTGHVPVLLAGAADDPERRRLGHFLRKPLAPDEVLARVEQAFRRLDAARAAATDGGIEGDLAQLPVTDLLQILTTNRRTGRLALRHGDGTAEISLEAGRITDAAAGAAVGEKALFRLLVQREGPFTFRPGEPGGAGRIERRVEELLLDGMRHADEAARLRERVPGADERVVATGSGGPPQDLSAREVLALLAAPLTVRELLDRAAAPDLAVLAALAALLDAGRVRLAPVRGPAAAAGEPLLGPAALHALRTRLAGGRGGGGVPAGKLVLLGGGPEALRIVRSRLAARPEFEEARDAFPHGFGTVGRLDLGEARIDLLALPADAALHPVWRPFAAGALGALVLVPAAQGGPAASLVRSLRLVAGACGPEQPPLEPAVAAVCAAGHLGPDPARAISALLERVTADAPRRDA